MTRPCKQLDALSSLINQATFFMLCDRWFCPEDKLTSLYSLLFYHILTYLLMYTERLVTLHHYTPVVRVTGHSPVLHLALTATKFFLDFTKAMTFVITGVFMLLVFGLEQGMDHYNPTRCYIVITILYFLMTDRIFEQKAPDLLSRLRLDVFENLEVLWTPVLLRLVTSLVSGLMITLVWLCTTGGWILLLTAAYVNVFLGLKEMESYWQELLKERACLDRFRYASLQEILDQQDVCPVCLQTMVCARVTPCRHMFHGDCLRRWLKERDTCPMCKQVI